MQKSPSEIRFEIEVAMAQGHVYTLKDELTATYHCELTPEQEPKQRAKAQQAIGRKRQIVKDIERLKAEVKALQAEEKDLDSTILNFGEALNFTPPKGRFFFLGRHVASVDLRKEWLCDLETGAPILETVQELSKSSVVAIDEIRQGIQEPLPFPDDGTPISDDDDDSVDSDPDETHAESETFGSPFSESEPEKPARKRIKKADPDASLN